MTALNRALGAFYGLALGDALGMPTQSLDRETIKARFGQITDLHDAGPLQPIAANRNWMIRQVLNARWEK